MSAWAHAAIWLISLPVPGMARQARLITLFCSADGMIMVLRESLTSDSPGNKPCRWTCPGKGCGVRKQSTSMLYDHVDRSHADELAAAACTHLALMAPYITPEGDLVARLSTSNRWGHSEPQLLSNQVWYAMAV